jgi:predicted peptidase
VIALADAIRRFPERYPAIVVLPQAPMGGVWLEKALALAEASLAATEREFRTDPSRVYLTGYSMGGLGVYHLALRQPQRFAAIAILCAGFGLPEGAIPPDLVPLLARKEELFPPVYTLAANWKAAAPLRVYAGRKDKLVPPATLLKSVEAIRQAGVEVDYRELPEANHNVWDPVYRDPEFAQWLLTQRLPAKR